MLLQQFVRNIKKRESNKFKIIIKRRWKKETRKSPIVGMQPKTSHFHIAFPENPIFLDTNLYFPLNSFLVGRSNGSPLFFYGPIQNHFISSAFNENR
jgi:hypothetical protein